MAQRTIILTLDVADGPHDPDDTIAEWGAALPNVIDEAWGYTDDNLPANAMTVVSVHDVARGVDL